VADRGIAAHPNARAGALPRLAALASTLLLILAACGAPAAVSPAASVAAPSTPSPTPMVAASPEPAATAAVTPAPAPTRVAVGECTPDPLTPMSADWVEQASLSGDYRFKRPADWADLSADVTLPTNVSVSPTTFVETGLGADAEIQVDAVRSFDSVLVTAWVVEGVETRTDPLFERELAWLKTQPQIKAVISEDLEACLDGSTARGFNSTWSSGSADTYIVLFVLQRNGKMYEVQLTAPAAIAEVTYHEILSSWQFTEPLEAPGPTDLDAEFAATDFKVIGMSATLDDTGDVPNASTFQSVFPAMSERIYVLYELDDGAAETVNFSWAQGGRELFTNSFDYKTTTTFAWGWITPPSSGRFATGDYSVTLSLEDSGDTITVPFSVE
jgi:hypothetical protein